MGARKSLRMLGPAYLPGMLHLVSYDHSPLPGQPILRGTFRWECRSCGLSLNWRQ